MICKVGKYIAHSTTHKTKPMHIPSKTISVDNKTPKTRFHRELQRCFFGGRPVVTAAFCIVQNAAVQITEDICCFRFPSGYRL